MDNKTTSLVIISVVLAVLLAISVAINLDNSLVSISSPLGDNGKNQGLENENRRLQGTVSNLQSENQRLQGTVSSLQDENQRLQGTVSSLQDENQRLQGTAQELRDITNLAKSQSIVEKYNINQQANQYNRWTFNAQYAGYIFVRIDSSTTNLAYAKVSYTSNGGQSPHTIKYDQRSGSLSSGSWICFPVLPGTIYIDVGNTNLVNGATHTVTIEYWY